MAPTRSRLFTIPASRPFLPTLAAALLDGRLVPGFGPRGDLLALTDATVFLPTRRAARAFASAILAETGGEAAFLPRIVPLGDVDEDALAFVEETAAFAQPAAVDPVTRKLVLAKLTLQWAKQLPGVTGDEDRLVAATPAAAFALADALTRIFDDLTIADVPLERLAGLVPEKLDKYWKISLDFLRIAHKGWVDYLEERGLADPTKRRDELIRREVEYLATGTGGPVIAAGSTGSLPAVANLLVAIARRPDGAVVLPGLDQTLDDESFALIDGGKVADRKFDPSPGHPQFGLKRLVERFGITRKDVEALAAPAAPEREKLISEAFRPAVTSERWANRTKSLSPGAAQSAFADIKVIEAADPREEALAIALVLRETIEVKDKTAALVTPDRTLARRVAAELTRWGMAVDDSAGTPLTETEAGRLARLVATAAAERLAPLPLIALLRHPFVRLGTSAEIDALERAVLRGPRPAPGAEGLVHALAEAQEIQFHPRDRRASIQLSDWKAAGDLADRIGKALDPLLALADDGVLSFKDLIVAHLAALQAIGFDLASGGSDEAEKLREAFKTLADSAADAPELTLGGYAEVFAVLIADQPVRPRFDPQARIRILGPLEARLIGVDCLVLGGLNEGTWPPESHSDAWLNRPMRCELGLDLPERRIGLSAHDFAQAFGAREVVLTRASREKGAETVASRFLQRIQAVAPEQAWSEACARGQSLLVLARELDRPHAPKPIERPRPTPPLATRPERLSVSEIEDLVRDPYTIYARHVLKLVPLEEIDAEPGAAERGILLHRVLAHFARSFPETMPADALAQLLRIGEQTFAEIKDFPGIHAVWWPRFERVAQWFIGSEVERRTNITRTLAEHNGKIAFDIGGRNFTLSARADRIDCLKDGSIAIFDYKTGEVPTAKQALIGLAPQLPLEGTIASVGGFPDIKASTSVSELAIVKLSGGHPPGEVKPFKLEQIEIKTFDQLADISLGRLKRLLGAYAREKQPYHSIPRPKWRSRYGLYDHLARIKEWTAEGEES
jgi:ATP-dependent helicase/nuclease subunit B